MFIINIRNLSLSKKLILGSGALAIISLFFPWVELGFISVSGFQQDGYIFLLAFIYPVYCVIKKQNINKVGGLLCGGIAIIAAITYMNSKSQEFFGETINATGTGLYLFLVAAILLTVAIFRS